MKIDAHQHFWKYNKDEYAWINRQMCILKNDYLPGELNQLIKQNGFQGTITVQARQSLDETRWLLKLATENEFIKGVVGWVDLCSVSLEDQLHEFIEHPKFVGVRHVLQDEPDDYFMLRESFIRGTGLLNKFNLVYEILIFPGHLPQTAEFLSHFPDQPFVLDHIAKPDIKNKVISPWKEGILKLAQFENVYCKLSGMVTEADWQNWSEEDFKPYLDVILNAFGTDRLMIGSDWPVCLIAGKYRDVMNIPFHYFQKFSHHEQEAIFGLNAKKVYGIKP